MAKEAVSRAQTRLAWLVFPRLYMGYMFLTGGWKKLVEMGLLKPGTLDEMLGKMGANAFHLPWYQHFIDSVVLPHGQVFGYLVTFGELALGISLLLGLMVRFSAVVGMFMTLNFFLASGSPLAAMFFFTLLTMCLAAAGRSLGLDAYLHRAFPRMPFW